MPATLTLDLDPSVLELAEREARQHQTSLAKIVGDQLRIMARNWRDSQEGKTPITDALRGSVQLPSDFDERETLAKELIQRHGGRE